MPSNIDDQLIELIKNGRYAQCELLMRRHGKLPPIDFPHAVEEKVLMRCARYYYAGIISHLTPRWVTFKKGGAAWVADTGRFSRILKDGFIENESEVEMYDEEVHVPIGTILDTTKFKHPIKNF